MPAVFDTQMRQRVVGRKSALFTERSSWDSHWRDLVDHVDPRRARFLSNQRNRGERKNTKIINETATLSKRTLQSGLLAGVSSPARPWFRLAVPEPGLMNNRKVRAWLYEVERRMRAAFARSNLYNVLPQVYGDLGLLGTAAMTQTEHPQRTFHFMAHPIGSYALANGEDLFVNTMYREVDLTTSQMVERFGAKEVPAEVRNQYQRGDYFNYHTLIHAIEPNVDRDRSKSDNRNMPFRSLWVAQSDDRPDRILNVSGFNEFPAMTPRWETTGVDAYASNCPGMTALGSIRGLQLEERRKYQAIDKMVDPPLQAPNSIKRNGGVSLLPGDVTYFDVSQQGQEGVRTIYDQQFPVGEVREDILETVNRIRRAFFEDLFLMVANDTRSNITAREIAERHEEKLLMLGPVLERVHTELLDPLVERSFNMMLRGGELPEPPEEIRGAPLKVEYVSVLAQAQQMAGVGSMERFLGFVGNLSEAAPQAFDKVDVDKAVDEYGEMTGVPPTIIRSSEDAEQLRQSRAQAQAAEKAAEQVPQVAQGAKLLSETDTSRPSALNQLLGGIV